MSLCNTTFSMPGHIGFSSCVFSCENCNAVVLTVLGNIYVSLGENVADTERGYIVKAILYMPVENWLRSTHSTKVGSEAKARI